MSERPANGDQWLCADRLGGEQVVTVVNTEVMRATPHPFAEPEPDGRVMVRRPTVDMLALVEPDDLLEFVPMVTYG